MPFDFPEATQGGDFEPAPAGSHIAVCVRVIDLGTQEVTFQGQTKQQHKVSIAWELPDERRDDGKPFLITNRYTLSMHEKSTLRKHLESWRGRAFSHEEIGPGGSFKPRNLLGVGCMLSIIHQERNGRTYANISSVSKMPKNMQTPAAENPLIYFSLKPDEFNEDQLGALSERMQETITASPEYRRLMDPDGAPVDDEPRHPDLDDDIPF